MLKQSVQNIWQKYYEYLLVPVGLLIFFQFWQWLAKFYEPYILPAPFEVLQRFQEFGLEQLGRHFWATTQEAFLGFAMGLVLAIPLGYLLAHSQMLEKCLTPYIVGFQAIPILALAPLLVIWFGFGNFSKILVAALVAFFPILTNTIIGFRATTPSLKEFVTILGAKRAQIFWKLELPAALPVLLGGLKLGITLAVIGAVVGEFAGASVGLGYLVNAARGSFDTPLIFVALITLACLGIGFYLLITLLEYLVMPWKRVKS